MASVQMPCEDRALAREGCNGLTSASRPFPDGYTPTEEELSGYLCEACAHARVLAAQPPPLPEEPLVEPAPAAPPAPELPETPPPATEPAAPTDPVPPPAEPTNS
jgi:hypothetical protein